MYKMMEVAAEDLAKVCKRGSGMQIAIHNATAQEIFNALKGHVDVRTVTAGMPELALDDSMPTILEGVNRLNTFDQKCFWTKVFSIYFRNTLIVGSDDIRDSGIWLKNRLMNINLKKEA